MQMQLGKILDNKILKDQRAQPHSELGAGTGLEQKQGTRHPQLFKTTKGGKPRLSHPSSLVSEYTLSLLPHKESASPSQEWTKELITCSC